MPVVSSLRIVPVKGLASITTDSVRIEPEGAADDRRLFLLDAKGAVVTLRSHPQLVTATPALNLEERVLRVTLADGSRATSSLDVGAEQVRAQLFGKDREGRVIPGDVADALSTLAGEPVRVVLADRVGVGWDEGPVSILGRASAQAVGGPDVDMARFRMLLEVDGTQPYEEDTWVGSEVDIGSARVRVDDALVRCVIITQSPATGAKDWDGLHVLAQTRGPDLCLGVIAAVTAPGTVRVGDEVALVTP